MFTSTFAAFVAVLASISSAAAKDSRTFAVLRFHGDGPLTIGRTDPIVSPGKVSSHVHLVQGGNAFSNSATGDSMLESTCSTANIAADKSAYWMPRLYFRDPNNGSFEPVPLFYMNVYYFFEATNDDIKAFPVGLQMVSGNATRKTPPATGSDVLDPSDGTIQPAQFTCPRSSYDPPSYPVDSDGTMAGIQDSGNKGAGAGFPFAECDGYASPLRADLHFPSCYDPSKELTDFAANMAFPTDAGAGKQDCPAGWLHVPHIFYEMYWNTPLFVDRWTPNEDSQPFVLANGDAAGYSLHGDFLAAWNETVLQSIIETCDAGDAGMDKCPGVETVLTGNCQIDNPSPEQIDGVLAALPGNNPLFGWQYGTGVGVSAAASTKVTKTTSTKATEVTEATSTNVAVSSVTNGTTVRAATTPSTTSSSSTWSTARYSNATVAVVGNAAVPSNLASTFATSTSSSTSTSTTTTAPANSPQKGGCRMPTQESTTTITVPVTIYSTSTSTVTRTGALPTQSVNGTAAAKRGEQAKSQRRHARKLF